jgi:hypothetical protein
MIQLYPVRRRNYYSHDVFSLEACRDFLIESHVLGYKEKNVDGETFSMCAKSLQRLTFARKGTEKALYRLL